MTLTDLNNGFRDDEQRRRVQRVVHDRLADDRDPQECRFLMRFWWQLVMSYQEVSMDELSLNVGKPKLDVIEALISVTPELKQALEDKTLPVKVARIVGQLPEQQQQSAAEEALAQRPSRRQSQHPSAGAPESQSERAMASSVQRTDEDLGALAADLKRRLTSQQIEELVELLID